MSYQPAYILMAGKVVRANELFFRALGVLWKERGAFSVTYFQIGYTKRRD